MEAQPCRTDGSISPRLFMSTEQILERLMREYGDSVFRMCFLYLKDYHLAEDATQGTFMKAMKKLKDYFELHIK